MKLIKKSFGDLVFGHDDPNSIKELIDELNIKASIKQLNNRLLTQNIILQTLVDIIENGFVTEKELELRISNNIKNTEQLLDELRKDTSEDLDVWEGLYSPCWGAIKFFTNLLGIFKFFVYVREVCLTKGGTAKNRKL